MKDEHLKIALYYKMEGLGDFDTTSMFTSKCLTS